jgi:hypothetical protein
MKYLIVPISFVAICLMAFVGPEKTAPAESSPLVGAWELKSVNNAAPEDSRSVWVFSQDYMSRTDFSVEGKRFDGTRGGVFKHEGYKLLEQREFDTWDAENVGQEYAYKINLNEDNELDVWINDDENKVHEVWTRIDNGSTDLAGAWQITQRMRDDGKMHEIHRTGTRKTVKLLSGTRFQWIAIDPGKKSFSGTGGGTYTFENGTYTENIEFFSRDASRVGMSLSFQGKVDGDDWHHSGKSSKGKPISEVWSR